MGKRMKALVAKVDKTKTYSIDEAIKLIKETSNTKFDSSVEVHVRLGIDPSKSDQQIRSTVSLPHGNGKTKTVAAFVGSNDEKAAKEAGADFIYGEEDIKKLKDTGKIEFEIAVATPEMMPKLAIVAKILGPKGLMPNPKTDTVSTDVKKMITELKKGKIAFKNDSGAILHASIGKASFTESQIKENVIAFVETVKKLKPSGSKGTYIKSLYLTSSMGPSVKTEVPV
jgi:large subunit ribosomal protein L1